ncbi:uncharacterized protein LOC119672833 [Teleopsis dalmanni]|nr:uncharacterized protein LOC119672833 [Teleopsis dalmanni]
MAELKEFYFKSEPGIMELLAKLTEDYANYSSKVVEKWPGYAKIAEKMRKNVGDTFKQKILKIFPKEQALVKVLVHADLWIKNILMLRDAEGPKDAIFVDYQMCFEGSPALDIHNLFITSVKLDVLKTKRLELIRHYYDVLRTTLIACDYNRDDIPTLDDILYEVQRTEFFSYYELVFPFAQTNLSDKLTEGLGVGDLTEENNMERTLKDIYSNRRVLDTYAYELRRLDDLGILD